MMWILSTVLLSSVIHASRLLQQAAPSPNLCEQNCASYSDGCNTCNCRMTSSGRVAVCTERACSPDQIVPEYCTKCGTGYTLDGATGQCIPGCGDIPYCARYKRDTCTTCKCGLGLSCGRVSTCEPSPIPENQCIECLFGFILNEAANECVQDPTIPIECATFDCPVQSECCDDGNGGVTCCSTIVECENNHDCDEGYQCKADPLCTYNNEGGANSGHEPKPGDNAGCGNDKVCIDNGGKCVWNGDCDDGYSCYNHGNEGSAYCVAYQSP